MQTVLIFRDGGDMAILQSQRGDPYLSWLAFSLSISSWERPSALGYIGDGAVLAALSWRTQALDPGLQPSVFFLFWGLARLSFNGGWVELSSGAPFALLCISTKILPSETHPPFGAMPAVVLLAVWQPPVSRDGRETTLLVLAWIPFEMVVICLATRAPGAPRDLLSSTSRSKTPTALYWTPGGRSNMASCYWSCSKHRLQSSSQMPEQVPRHSWAIPHWPCWPLPASHAQTTEPLCFKPSLNDKH